MSDGIVVTRAQAVSIFQQLGYGTADAWGPARMAGRLADLSGISDESAEIEPPGLKKLFIDLLVASDLGNPITLVRTPVEEVPAEKPGAQDEEPQAEAEEAATEDDAPEEEKTAEETPPVPPIVPVDVVSTKYPDVKNINNLFGKNYTSMSVEEFGRRIGTELRLDADPVEVKTHLGKMILIPNTDVPALQLLLLIVQNICPSLVLKTSRDYAKRKKVSSHKPPNMTAGKSDKLRLYEHWSKNYSSSLESRKTVAVLLKKELGVRASLASIITWISAWRNGKDFPTI